MQHLLSKPSLAHSVPSSEAFLDEVTTVLFDPYSAVAMFASTFCFTFYSAATPANIFSFLRCSRRCFVRGFATFVFCSICEQAATCGASLHFDEERQLTSSNSSCLFSSSTMFTSSRLD